MNGYLITWIDMLSPNSNKLARFQIKKKKINQAEACLQLFIIRKNPNYQIEGFKIVLSKIRNYWLVRPTY